MYSFSKRSKSHLITCDRKLQAICNDAIKYADFTVVTGHRTKTEQNKLYPKYTKVFWPNSRHNSFPSEAVDVAPYIKPYGALVGSDQQLIKIANMRSTSTEQARIFVFKAYARLIGILEGIAFKRGIDLRVGLDWDGDFDLLDQKFNDLMHIELRR
jgi:peptidoglycan L-alanyl-D-glutamate endopeptidase CwlK